MFGSPSDSQGDRLPPNKIAQKCVQNNGCTSDVRKTERYKLGEVVANRCRFLLFLTATPHRGDPENFRLLLNLLEPDFFCLH